MKTQFLGLGLIAAMAFTSCQSDVTTEDPQEIIEIQNSKKEPKHDLSKWHVPEGDPGGIIDNGFKLHEPGYFQGALANCDTYGHYEGGETLMVIEDAPKSYHGEVDVDKIVTNDRLNICGTVKVKNDVKVNYGSLFNLGGEMFTEGNVMVSYGGHLVIEGNVIINGDLVLTKGAILKFLGEDSSIEVLGKAKLHKDAKIEGEFADVSNKIK